jgi:hypothetical protein
MSGTRVYRVRDAAKLLSISKKAVRKQIAAKTIESYRAHGRWYVVLPVDPPASRHTSGSRSETEPNGTGQNQLEDVVTLVEQQAARISELVDQIGSLRTEVEMAQKRIQRLEARSVVEAVAARRARQDSIPEVVPLLLENRSESPQRVDAGTMTSEKDDAPGLVIVPEEGETGSSEGGASAGSAPSRGEPASERHPITSYIRPFLLILSVALLIAMMLASPALRELATAPLDMNDLRRFALVLAFVLVVTSLRYIPQVGYRRNR